MFSYPRQLLGATLLAVPLLMAAPHAMAQPEPYLATFKPQDIASNSTTLHVRVGRSGHSVVLLHGFGATGDIWTPLAVELAKNHRVVVSDLRGIGLPAKPGDGLQNNNQARDIRRVLDTLGIDQADIAGHDVGMVEAFAYSASYATKTTRLVVMNVPPPSIPPWDEVARIPKLWDLDFYVKDVLRVGNAGTNVTELVSPRLGHWLMEEEPAAVIRVSPPSWPREWRRDENRRPSGSSVLRVAPAVQV